MTTALIERWPILRTLNDALTPGRWAATFFAAALGQFIFWVALLHLLVGDREQVERLMYFVGFTLLPLISALITFGGAWIVQRAGRDLCAFSDGLIVFNLSLALVLGLLGRGEFFNTTADFWPWTRWQALASAQPALAFGFDLAALRAELGDRASAWPLAALILSAIAQGGALALTWTPQAQFKRAVLAFVWVLGGAALALAWPNFDLLRQTQARTPQTIEVAQEGAPPVRFVWKLSSEYCLDYAFSAESAQAVWLDRQGLAHVDAVNEGQICGDMPLPLRVADWQGRESHFLVGLKPAGGIDAWPLALAFGLVAPLLLLWGGAGAALSLALIGLGALFGWAFLPVGVDSAPVLIGAGLGAALLSLIPRRDGRWFDLALGLLIVGLCVNLGFLHDQFHYHSGWMGTVNAMLHGQTLMVDAFSQRGFLSMVTLAAVFSVLPLTYPMFSLLISGLLAAQFLAVYALLKWAGVGRWWAACAVLAGMALHLHYNSVSLGVIRFPGYSPLRFGTLFLLALAVSWRLRTGRRAAQWIEWAALVYGVLWGLDSAIVVLGGYGSLLAYEAFHQHGMTRVGLVWLLRRGLFALSLIGVAFGLANLWLWLSTGQAPRWDFYWGFYVYHEDHRFYQRAVQFWSHGWWLNIVPQFAALLVAGWRTVTGRSSKTWRGEALIVLVAAGGVLQFYHYATNSVHPYNHIVPAIISLAYLASLIRWRMSLWRWAGLAGALALWGLQIASPATRATWEAAPPLALALLRLFDGSSVEAIALRWEGFEDAYASDVFATGDRQVQNPRVSEAVALARRYSAQANRVGMYLHANETLQALLILRAAHHSGQSFGPHDSRVPGLAAQLVASKPGRAGEVIYLSAEPLRLEEAHPLTLPLLDGLCRRFDFELLETSPHGVMAIRLHESSGQNATCEEHGLYILYTEESS
ncbi:MAG: hypothetical protein NZ750_03010 [Anaerolineae bacterium]|nr:hypothetical protein [Anaerolineae bacterium]MDW8172727.1 hypothetical protein [Anaerolineae bacterium]